MHVLLYVPTCAVLMPALISIKMLVESVHTLSTVLDILFSHFVLLVDIYYAARLV